MDKSASYEAKRKALESAIGQLDKKFGKGALMRMGDKEEIQEIEAISTGSLNLDIALGVGGLPKGRIVELYGAESAGKSTLALHCVAECQKAGGIAAYIDAEHALDPQYAKALGVNVDDMYISQPDNGEQALEICDTVVRSGTVDLVVVDSVAALVPQAELNGEMGDAHVGLQARLMSQGLRKLTAGVSQSKCVVLFINQLREKVGVMYGNPETTTGGRALKYYSSVRMDIRRVETIKNGNVPTANRVRVKVVKNKVAPPFREAEFEIIFGQGISKESEIIDAAVNFDIISKGGAWYTYENMETGRTERWQGKEKVKEALAADEALREEIEEQVIEHLRPKKKSEDE